LGGLTLSDFPQGARRDLRDPRNGGEVKGLDPGAPQDETRQQALRQLGSGEDRMGFGQGGLCALCVSLGNGAGHRLVDLVGQLAELTNEALEFLEAGRSVEAQRRWTLAPKGAGSALWRGPSSVLV
jgi:hypothetical protein